MSNTNLFAPFLTTNGHVIIDGALATELQNRGCDLNDSLWSAKVLIEQPDLISDVHYDYFMAGADCAITASYQATPLGFKKRGLSTVQAIALIEKSVLLAQQAKSKYQHTTKNYRPLIIAGSVGPYGAYLADGSEYTGNYALSETEMTDFHAERIDALIRAGVDIIAFETMPSFTEIKVLTQLISQYRNMPCWFSFTLQDSQHLSDGTPLDNVVDYLNSIEPVIALGVNCIALDKVTDALNELQQLTDKPLIAYPNSGEHYDAKTKTWQSLPHQPTLCQQLSAWQQHGAKLIGGCCRTTPIDIKNIALALTRTDE
ncbi:homocysteine S-methyltransferase [Orbus hercynius]|uniref:S-methylmethionine:homocysteine methyltransferase n=1 Tax=Orbus hercynius TaxID=593135 RepID=A0A495RJD0_9GAMM|nr:homocysteine S-methyltransferase [Orbus hercynius]RKS87266.1 homocysteine S-methyltransferase [Orbus hercynius]